MTKGVYEIRNTYNGKVYVGYSKNIERRWYNHKSEFRTRTHRNQRLQEDWDLFKDYFVLNILDSVKDKKSYIESIPKGKLYNRNTSIHSWNTFRHKIKKVVDADGDILPLIHCPNCDLDKMSSSFVEESFYCLSCREDFENSFSSSYY